MKVVHVNTNDRGGAATAIIRIHLALMSIGVDSHILFLNNAGKSVPNSHYFQRPHQSLWSRVKRKLAGDYIAEAMKIRDQHPSVEWYTDPRTPFDISAHPLVRSADIIQLNWVSGFVDEESFFKKVSVPVVWRMPDLYPTGGGFHYKKGFPFEALEKKLKKNTSIRKKCLENAKVTFVPISHWVLAEAKESDIIGTFPMEVIHNGLDFDKVPDVDDGVTRADFGFPIDKKIVLLGADRIHAERKGFRKALMALDLLDVPNIQVVIFGNYKGDSIDGVTEMGYLESNELYRLFAASDLFLMPSIEEAFGQVFIESLAMGTPVVAYPSGGARDVIVPGKNGVIAKSFETADLAHAIQQGLNHDFDREWIMNDVRKRFDITDKAKMYLKLYNKLNF